MFIILSLLKFVFSGLSQTSAAKMSYKNVIITSCVNTTCKDSTRCFTLASWSLYGYVT